MKKRTGAGIDPQRFLRLHQGTTARSANGQPMLDRLFEIWDRREVLQMLVGRGLRNKYASSVLGYAWSLLEPALRDIERGIGMVVRMLFYLSPVLYPLRRLSPTGRRLESFNPMTGIVEINRAVWLPRYWTTWRPVATSTIGAAAVLVVGFLVFARVERAVLKEL